MQKRSQCHATGCLNTFKAGLEYTRDVLGRSRYDLPIRSCRSGADFHRYFEKALAPCKNGLNVMPRDA